MNVALPQRYLIQRRKRVAMTSQSPPRRVILLMKQNSYRGQAFMEAAVQIGVEPIPGIDVPPRLARGWREGIPLQFDQPEAAVETLTRFAAHTPVQAILAVDDSAVVIAAQASARLGLPHNPPAAALAVRNKYHMRRRLAEGGAACPAFTLHHLTDDPQTAAAATTYPCVLKPLHLNGSRGVMRADSPAEFVLAWKRLARILTQAGGPEADKILVESYIPGVEVAVEGLLDGGKLHVLALFDKPDPLEGPFFEETIYVTPSRLPEAVQQAIADCTAQAAAALGLQMGPVHAELRVNEAGPWIVEVAGRSIGGLCAKTLRFGPNVSLEALILRQAVGLPLALNLPSEARGVMMIPIPEAGILKAVHGLEAAQAVAGIESVEITARLNQPVTPLPEGDSYLGFIFARGQSPAQVEAALREAHRRLSFELLPVLPVW